MNHQQKAGITRKINRALAQLGFPAEVAEKVSAMVNGTRKAGLVKIPREVTKRMGQLFADGEKNLVVSRGPNAWRVWTTATFTQKQKTMVETRHKYLGKTGNGKSQLELVA